MCKLVPLHAQAVDVIVPATKTANAATVEDHIYRKPEFTHVKDNTFHKSVVVNAAKLAPHALTPVSAKSTCTRRQVIKPINDSTSRTPLQVVKKGVVDVIPNKPFYILLKNISIKPVHIPKRIIVAHIKDSPA